MRGGFLFAGGLSKRRRACSNSFAGQGGAFIGFGESCFRVSEDLRRLCQFSFSLFEFLLGAPSSLFRFFAAPFGGAGLFFGGFDADFGFGQAEAGQLNITHQFRRG